ncbi:hypothetical protein [Hungatella effluvii]|uniref:hypothetical protein n=1 Tax=Hungatella effluvii TaxID=1096246 RepID=UPI002A83F8D6|nr:hypothetical protein [Hungatella effluvii]
MDYKTGSFSHLLISERHIHPDMPPIYIFYETKKLSDHTTIAGEFYAKIFHDNSAIPYNSTHQQFADSVENIVQEGTCRKQYCAVMIILINPVCQCISGPHISDRF